MKLTIRVQGRPGCGKTTALKALDARRDPRNHENSGYRAHCASPEDEVRYLEWCIEQAKTP